VLIDYLDLRQIREAISTDLRIFKRLREYLVRLIELIGLKTKSLKAKRRASCLLKRRRGTSFAFISELLELVGSLSLNLALKRDLSLPLRAI
jgi:hypothetical protein